jgi:hypothetical protein
MGDSDYKYFFSNKGKAMISRQPRRPQQQNGPPVPKNSSRTNPFALLDEQDLDEPSDSRIRQELTLRPRAETANPNKTRFVTKHVISATQHGVQTVQKVSTLSAASSSAADTPLSSSERTANDEDDYLIGPLHLNARLNLTRQVSMSTTTLSKNGFAVITVAETMRETP